VPDLKRAEFGISKTKHPCQRESEFLNKRISSTLSRVLGREPGNARITGVEAGPGAVPAIKKTPDETLTVFSVNEQTNASLFSFYPVLFR
jgi:hypothetical protein